jgi:spore germination protein YaaH
MGIPRSETSLASSSWYPDRGVNKKDKTPNVTADFISQPTAVYLRNTYRGKEQWYAIDHTPWFYFYRDDIREWVFYTNQLAFMERYDLTQQHRLQGIFSWILGDEDPGVWPALLPAYRFGNDTNFPANIPAANNGAAERAVESRG